MFSSRQDERWMGHIFSLILNLSTTRNVRHYDKPCFNLPADQYLTSSVYSIPFLSALVLARLTRCTFSLDRA